MSSLQTIETPQDYVNYTFNLSARGITEVSAELAGMSNTISNLLGLMAFKTSEYLTHTESLAIGVGVAATAAFASATENALKFEQAVANVQAIGGESINAGIIGEKAMEYSNKFGMNVDSMTEGLEALARAGLTATNVMSGVLEEGVKLSKLEGIDLEESINDLISTTNLLSETEMDVNTQEYADAVKAMNQHIVSTSESAPINAQNIMQTLQHVGGYASANKIDQDDLFAVIAQLGAKGTKGEMAGTALRAFIAAGQKDQAQRALARIGLNVSDLWDESGEAMLSVSEMKDVLDNALEARGFSKQEKLEFYSDFAGYKQANQIMKINTNEVQKYKETIANAWDLGTKLNTILGTANSNLQIIFQTTKNFMTKVGKNALSLLNAALIPIKMAVQLIDKIPLSDKLVGIGLGFLGIKSVLLFINQVIPALATLYTSLNNGEEKVKGIAGYFRNIREDVEQSVKILKLLKAGDTEGLTKERLKTEKAGNLDTETLHTLTVASLTPDWDSLSKAQQKIVLNASVLWREEDNYKAAFKEMEEMQGQILENLHDSIVSYQTQEVVENVRIFVNQDETPQDNRSRNSRINERRQGSRFDGAAQESRRERFQDSQIYKGLKRGTQTDIAKAILGTKERLADAIGRGVARALNVKSIKITDLLGKYEIDSVRQTGILKELQDMEIKANVDLGDARFLFDSVDEMESKLREAEANLQNYIRAFSNINLNHLNWNQINIAEKVLSRKAMSETGKRESTRQNAIDIRNVLTTGRWNNPGDNSGMGIRDDQIKVIENILNISNREGGRTARLERAYRELQTRSGDEQERLLKDIQEKTSEKWKTYLDKLDRENKPSQYARKHLTDEKANYIAQQLQLTGYDTVEGSANKLLLHFQSNDNEEELLEAAKILAQIMQYDSANIFNAKETETMVHQMRTILQLKKAIALEKGEDVSSFQSKIATKKMLSEYTHDPMISDRVKSTMTSGYNMSANPDVSFNKERLDDFLKNGLMVANNKEWMYALGESNGQSLVLSFVDIMQESMEENEKYGDLVFGTFIHELSHVVLQHKQRQKLTNSPYAIPKTMAINPENAGGYESNLIEEYEAMLVEDHMAQMFGLSSYHKNDISAIGDELRRQGINTSFSEYVAAEMAHTLKENMGTILGNIDSLEALNNKKMHTASLGSWNETRNQITNSLSTSNITAETSDDNNYIQKLIDNVEVEIKSLNIFKKYIQRRNNLLMDLWIEYQRQEQGFGTPFNIKDKDTYLHHPLLLSKLGRDYLRELEIYDRFNYDDLYDENGRYIIDRRNKKKFIHTSSNIVKPPFKSLRHSIVSDADRKILNNYDLYDAAQAILADTNFSQYAIDSKKRNIIGQLQKEDLIRQNALNWDDERAFYDAFIFPHSTQISAYGRGLDVRKTGSYNKHLAKFSSKYGIAHLSKAEQEKQYLEFIKEAHEIINDSMFNYGVPLSQDTVFFRGGRIPSVNKNGIGFFNGITSATYNQAIGVFDYVQKNKNRALLKLFTPKDIHSFMGAGSIISEINHNDLYEAEQERTFGHNQAFLQIREPYNVKINGEIKKAVDLLLLTDKHITQLKKEADDTFKSKRNRIAPPEDVDILYRDNDYTKNRIYLTGIDLLTRESNSIQEIISNFNIDDYKYETERESQLNTQQKMKDLQMQKVNASRADRENLGEFAARYGFDVSMFERLERDFTDFVSIIHYMRQGPDDLQGVLYDMFDEEEVDSFIEEINRGIQGGLDWSSIAYYSDYQDMVEIVEEYYHDFLEEMSDSMYRLISNSPGFLEPTKIYRGGQIPFRLNTNSIGEFLGSTSTSFAGRIAKIYANKKDYRAFMEIFAAQGVKGIMPFLDFAYNDDYEALYDNQQEYTIGSGQVAIGYPHVKKLDPFAINPYHVPIYLPNEEEMAEIQKEAIDVAEDTFKSNIRKTSNQKLQDEIDNLDFMINSGLAQLTIKEVTQFQNQLMSVFSSFNNENWSKYGREQSEKALRDRVEAIRFTADEIMAYGLYKNSYSKNIRNVFSPLSFLGSKVLTEKFDNFESYGFLQDVLIEMNNIDAAYNLLSAFKKAPYIPSSSIIHRVGDYDDADNVILNDNGTGYFQGPVSTSYRRRVIQEGILSNKYEDPYYMRLYAPFKIPALTDSMYYDGTRNRLGGYSDSFNENEATLAPRQAFIEIARNDVDREVSLLLIPFQHIATMANEFENEMDTTFKSKRRKTKNGEQSTLDDFIRGKRQDQSQIKREKENQMNLRMLLNTLVINKAQRGIIQKLLVEGSNELIVKELKKSNNELKDSDAKVISSFLMDNPSQLKAIKNKPNETINKIIDDKSVKAEIFSKMIGGEGVTPYAPKSLYETHKEFVYNDENANKDRKNYNVVMPVQHAGPQHEVTILGPDAKEYVDFYTNEEKKRNKIHKAILEKEWDDYFIGKEGYVGVLKEQEEIRKRLIGLMGIENEMRQKEIEGRENAQKNREAQRKRWEEQKKPFEEERQRQREAEAERKRAEREREKINEENQKSIWVKLRDKIDDKFGPEYYYFGGEKKIKQTKEKEQMRRWGIEATNIGEVIESNIASFINKGAERIDVQHNKYQGNIFQESADALDKSSKSLKSFTSALKDLSEVFPFLTPAVAGLSTAIQVGDGAIDTLNAISKFLKVTQGEDGAKSELEKLAKDNPIAKAFNYFAGLKDSNSELGQSIYQMGANVTQKANALIGKNLMKLLVKIAPYILPITVIIGTVLIAIKGIQFWERKHAEALKATEEELKETTTQSNIALSQYKDLKMARENETDVLKRQQAARREAIALYELEVNGLKRLNTINKYSQLKSDNVWGEYGMRAGWQRFTHGHNLISGEFKSVYQDYEGTTANIRQIREEVVGNLFATSAQKEVAAFYDRNILAFGEIEAFSKELNELYDKESQLIEQYGSIEAARETEEFNKAVQEFSDATRLNGETAVKYLDWLETENKVDKATQAMQLEVNMIVAEATRNAFAALYPDKDFDSATGIRDAMIYAQADKMIQDAYSQLWWEAFGNQLWAYFDLLLYIINPKDWLGELLGWEDTHYQMYKKHDEAAKAYTKGQESLIENTDNIIRMGEEAADKADRRDYGTKSNMYNDEPFGFAISNAIYMEKNAISDGTKSIEDILSYGMKKAGEEGVSSFKKGLNQHSPGDISNSVFDELVYSQNFIETLTPLLGESFALLGQEEVLKHNQGLGKDGDLPGHISGSVSDELIRSQELIETSTPLLGESFALLGQEEVLKHNQGLGKDGDLPGHISGSISDELINSQNFIEASTPLLNTSFSSLGQEEVLGHNQGLGKDGDLPGLIPKHTQQELDYTKNVLQENQEPIGQASYDLGYETGQQYAKGFKDGLNDLYEQVSTQEALSDTLKQKILYNQGLKTAPNKQSVPNDETKETAIESVADVGSFVLPKILGQLGEAVFKKFVKKGVSKGLNELGEATGKAGLKTAGKTFTKIAPYIGPAVTAANAIYEHNPYEKHYNEDGSEKRALQATGEVVGETAGALAAMGLGRAVEGAVTAFTLNPVLGFIAGAGVEMVASLILEPIGEAIGGTIGWLADEIVNTPIKDIWGGFNDALGGIPGQIYDFIDQSPIGDLGHWAFNQLDSLTGGWLSSTWDYISNSSIASMAGDAWNQISGVAGNAWDWLSGAAGNTWDWLSGAAGNTWDWLSGAANNTWNWLFGGEEKSQSALNNGHNLLLTTDGMTVGPQWSAPPAEGLRGSLYEQIEGRKDPIAGVFYTLRRLLYNNDKEPIYSKYDISKNGKVSYDSAKAAINKKTKDISTDNSKNTIVIKNININTEDDPEKIKTAFMNLMIELEEQITPRQVSRVVGEAPSASTNATADTDATNPNESTDPNDPNASTNPNDTSQNGTNNTNPTL